MAFGDLIKQDYVEGGGINTFTPDLLSNPTSGNLLIAAFGSNRDTRTVATPPSGFTELHDVLGLGGWAWYYKISVGTEQTASIVWSGNINGTGRYIEYEWDGSTPSVVKNDDQTNISTNTKSQPSGAATPTVSTNIAIAMHGVDENSINVDLDEAVDGSWIEDTAWDQFSGDTRISRLVNAALSSQEATFSCNVSEPGDNMYGAIAVFNSAAGGGATLLEATNYQGMNRMNGGMRS